MTRYRAHEYDTEEQPWDPISAVISALVGDVSSMAMAIGDIPKEWYKVAKKSGKGTDTANAAEASAAADSHDVASETTQETLPSLTSDNTSTLSPSGTADSATTENRPQALSGTSRGSPDPKSPDRPDHRRQGSGFDLEAALGASLETGKGVSRFVETGVKTPMNFCMGLAKGFRNAPKLYNDETVRKQEKVTGLASGLMLAGKEFGLGLFDGVTGLVTQPMRGAEKEGVQGLIKGFGKGIGGVMLKPVAGESLYAPSFAISRANHRSSANFGFGLMDFPTGFWAIPAYTMKGLHAEVRARFNKSVDSYIKVSRILQGQDDLHGAPVQERDDAVRRFRSMKDDMKGFQSAKSKSKQDVSSYEDVRSGSASAVGQGPEALGDEPPKTGFWATRHLSLEERRKLHALKDAWKQKKRAEAAGIALDLGTSRSNTGSNLSQASTAAASPSPNPATASSEAHSDEPEDAEMERAIRESVAQTSNGDQAEDARIESQIRASVREMRRVAEENRRWRQQRGPPPGLLAGADSSALPGSGDKATRLQEDATDEEFEAMVAEAVRQSMSAQGTAGERIGMVDREVGGEVDEDEHFRQALEESRRATAASAHSADEEELKRAIKESERAHHDHLQRKTTERSEENIIMEYVKKQSLAEEEFRRQQIGGGGDAAAAGAATSGNGEEEDAGLKRALDESLKLSGGKDGHSSSS